MTRFALSYAGAALAIAFVIDRWLHRNDPFKAQPDLKGYDALGEGEDGVQPYDPRPVYLVTVGRDDEWVGTYSLN